MGSGVKPPQPPDMIPFTPPPPATELPLRFPSPYDRTAVHPLARRAADELIATLQSEDALPFGAELAGGGKMFGVLVVESPVGTIGYLRAFSGMLDGRWKVDGWAPPAFDEAAWGAVWRDGEEVMRSTTPDTMAGRSRDLLPRLQEAYRFANARGEVRSLHELFAPAAPPGGAGDCAGPKLLAHAYRHGLRPIAMAELWWGAPPRSGDRHAGSFYPACRGKCAPILDHMLLGLSVDPAPRFGAGVIAASEPLVVYEDAHLLVVDKPSGLLSVPGRSLQLQDSVEARLRARYPEATGQLVVHRLDLDTSGVMIAAKDPATFSELQRLFSLRSVTKRYVAWLDGDVADEEGSIDLPLRVDVDDRPRQIHDPERGKPALTTWRVLQREGGRTKVEMTPLTGRTHQLRVHASHPLGLNAPIHGDRLYGRTIPEAGTRLMLHAEFLSFVHPRTGALVQVERPAPF
jgi:tRNA pseudouridine32 synthase / 23S rRNA pseudouridine746 synthase